MSKKQLWHARTVSGAHLYLGFDPLAEGVPSGIVSGPEYTDDCIYGRPYRYKSEIRINLKNIEYSYPEMFDVEGSE